MQHIVSTPEAIARLIHGERKRQALRQDDLAAMAGASDAFLRDLERGKPTVQLAKTLAVLGALGCRLELTPPAAGLPTGV